ncbi:class I SAM-dependent methyltransferase [Microbacterium sp. CFBP9034]|uniref:class I SAM-dependent methyltransferase n=1 Tax=Microbacterium sp. CFBP9034 TaxID=3096540 RepID=UPI002A69B7D6|nr:methyltransferase domain-containing protein [Microbacterium sp. CFBP9034]MDY0909439.1 methyltransferase domain-containing protein [Microbacterium sp. CFBP9034]
MADWSGTGEPYAQSFARLCEGAAEPLLDAIEAARGVPAAGRFLDVGTGAGTVAAAAARRGYTAQGVDAEASMVDAARRRHPSLPLTVAALPALPFRDGSFDAVAASFVLNHVADPLKSAGELARVAAPGGAVAITVWPWGPSPLRPLWEASLARSGAAAYPADSQSTEPDILRTPDGLAALLGAVGLAKIRATAVSWTFVISPADLWIGVAGGVATIGGIHQSLEDDSRTALHRAYLEETRLRIDDDGLLRFPHTAVLAVGVRAD